jgi:hypothetical protein
MTTEPDRITEITQLTDHAGEGAALVMHTLRSKPIFAAILAAWMVQVQAVETALWALLVDTTLATATGAALDQVGALLLAPRGGLTDDDDYRAVLRATVLARKSTGTAADLTAVLRAMLGVGPLFTYREGWASALLEPAAVLPFAATAAIGPLRTAKAAGVQLQLLDPPAAQSGLFTFASQAFVVEDDEPRGLGDEADDTVGGLFTGVVA